MSNIASKVREDDLRWVSGMTASYLRSTCSRPPIINLKAQLREGGWPRASMPEAEYAKSAWLAAAHGAGLKMPLVGIPGAGEDERNLGVIARIFGILQRHAWVYEDVRPAAPVALLWSQRTLDFYGREDAERRYTSAAHGFYAALVENHIPCVVIGENALTTERLRTFRTVVLPNAACLSEAEAAAIVSFAAQGGGVVATFETSLYDLRGNPLPGFLLEPAFGARCLSPKPESVPREAYLYKRAPHELIRSLGEAKVLPFAGSVVRVQPSGQAAAPLVLARHRGISIAEEVDNPEPETSPMCVVNSPGKGRVVYFPCSIDSFYFRNRLSGLRQLLGDAVDWTLRGRLIETNAPGGVQLVISEKPGFRFVHFINAVGRAPLDEIVPLAGIDVAFDAPPGARKVRSLLGGQTLAFSDEAGRIRFRLPRLDAYEVIVIEWA